MGPVGIFHAWGVRSRCNSLIPRSIWAVAFAQASWAWGQPLRRPPERRVGQSGSPRDSYSRDRGFKSLPCYYERRIVISILKKLEEVGEILTGNRKRIEELEKENSDLYVKIARLENKVDEQGAVIVKAEQDLKESSHNCEVAKSTLKEANDQLASIGRLVDRYVGGDPEAKDG